MRHFFSFSVILIFSIFFTSCDNYNTPENLAPEDFVPIKINNQYQINLPDYMSKTEELNVEASLQFMNEWKEAYAIVIDENKEEFEQALPLLVEGNMGQSTLAHYAEIQLASFEEIIVLDNEAIRENVSVNGLKAEFCQMSGTMDGIGVKYYFGFYESKTDLYMTILWTLKSRQIRYEETFLTALKSFKVLDK